MKKNTKKICVMLLLAVVAIASYFVSGTYAKYTRALGGSDTATVAKFSVTAGTLNKEQNAEIALFDTIKEEDTTSAEKHVKGNLIAPGTGGKFEIALTNASEVDVDAVITLKETANTSNVPIKYSLDGTTWDTADATTKTVNLNYVGGTKDSDTITVYWRWAFEDKTSEENTTKRDTADTDLGEKETAPTVTTKVTATFTQVD